MPLTINQAVDMIQASHRRTVRFNDDAKGGAHKPNGLGTGIQSWNSLGIWNHSSYGSRNTEGGRPIASSYIRVTLTFGGGQTKDIPLKPGVVAEIAKVRSLPEGSLDSLIFEIKDPFSRVLVQYGSRDIWILFDIDKAEDPGQALLDIYRIFFGPLDQPLPTRVPANRTAWENLQRTNLGLLPLHEVNIPPDTGPAPTQARRTPSPPPPRRDGEGKDWKNLSFPVTIEV